MSAAVPASSRVGRLDDDDGDDARHAAPADGVAVGSMTPVPGLVD